jgi:hypothetical protein
LNKAKVIARLVREDHRVLPHQEFEVSRMEPRDAWGVVCALYAIYKDQYPVETYYIPEKLIEENEKKNVFSVVARTPAGDIIGHGALYRSSAPFDRVYEFGEYFVLPDYRTTRAALEIQRYILKQVAPREEIDAVFGEAVCHHLIVQAFIARARYHETALEIGLMPARAYEREDFHDDRVSTLVAFKELRMKRHVTYLPAEYKDALAFILEKMSIERDFKDADSKAPQNVATAFTTEFFDFAKVARAHVHVTGRDFLEIVRAFKKKAAERAVEVMQFCINLGDPSSGEAVSLLRREGYFLGGFLPRWFDTDGFLMQKVLAIPSLASIKLYSEKAKRILQLMRKDVQENPACAAAAAKWGELS